ncbi:MAG: hypothetical protein J1F65_00220 [Clostridiales bacterium]|nr:hypothetical protein [Clostridiales bacterium]
MKSKKLLISLAVVAFVIVLIVVMIAVFSVKSVEVRYHDFSGREIVAVEGEGIVPDDILAMIKGNSTVFLSKTNLLNKINEAHGDWHAFAVVKNFPSMVEVHFVRRTVIAKMSIDGKDVYIDSFGYVVATPDQNDCVDITSAFVSPVPNTRTCEAGKPLEFVHEQYNAQLKYVLEAILTVWRCNVEVKNISLVLGDSDVFRVDSEGNLLISPKKGTGGTIKVISPETNLSNRLIKGYSVYYNGVQRWVYGDVITVHKNGSITSPDK